MDSDIPVAERRALSVAALQTERGRNCGENSQHKKTPPTVRSKGFHREREENDVRRIFLDVVTRPMAGALAVCACGILTILPSAGLIRDLRSTHPLDEDAACVVIPYHRACHA